MTRAVTVRGLLLLRPPDTMTLSSSTVFDVVVPEAAVESQRSSSLNRPTETFPQCHVPDHYDG